MNASFRKSLTALLFTGMALLSLPLFSQSRDSLFKANRDKYIVIRNNKFKVYNNWVDLGAGGANNFTRYGKQFTLGGDFNFHIHAEYLQLGIFFVGDALSNYNHYNYHLAYGRRKETQVFNFAVFGGLAYTTGFLKVDGHFSPDNIYDRVSAYANVQFTKKITYDTGLGLNFFADYSSYQFISGIRLDAYFSGAYKGKARKDTQD